MKRLLLIALLYTTGCIDQGWANPGHGDEAPGAPDCAPDDEECLGEDEPDSSADKHVGGTHRAYPGTVAGYQYDNCYPSGSVQCWWKWTDYNYYAVFYNNTPYGQPPKVWTVQKIYYAACYGGLGNSTTLAPGSITICTYGHCQDVSNINIVQSGQVLAGCRSGSVSLPMTVYPGSWAHVELFVNWHDSWQGNPLSVNQFYVSSIEYTD